MATVATCALALAEQLQPMLKPARGPAPTVPKIAAAIIMAKEDGSISSREACRNIPGVPQSARDRVAELAVRVRPLLPALTTQPAPPAQQMQPQSHVQQPRKKQPQAQQQLQAQQLQAQQLPGIPAVWDLPPLEATREPPGERPPSPPPPPSPPSSDDGSPPSFPLPDGLLAAPMPPLQQQPCVVKTSALPQPQPRLPPPSRPTELPDDARGDLDMDTYLHRESLRDPSLRCLLPKSLKRSMPGRAGRRGAQRCGVLGLEAEDLGLLFEDGLFTSGTGADPTPCPFPTPSKPTPTA